MKDGQFRYDFELLLRFLALLMSNQALLILYFGLLLWFSNAYLLFITAYQ
jgi:hypothetical protein